MPDDQANGHLDLWGAEFEPVRGDSAPIALLKEQADALTRRTGGLIEGVVLDEVHDGTAWFSLYARVPALQGYMQKILSVAHPLGVDPKNLDYPFPLSVSDTFIVTNHKIEGVEQFRSWLEAILSNKGTHMIIGNLLKFSKDRAAS